MRWLQRSWPVLAAIVVGCNVPGAPQASPPEQEEVFLPQPPPYGPFFIAANIDDDDGDGTEDYYQSSPPAGDDEVYILEVPPDLFALPGAAIGLAASGDVANLNIRFQGKDLLGPAASDPCPTIPVTGGNLEIQMSKPARFVTLTFHLIDDNSTSLASQSVRVASAPIVLNHHLQETERVWVMESSWSQKGNTIDNVQMVARLTSLLGGSLGVINGGQTGNDLWVQDEMELSTATSLHQNERVDVVLNSPRNRDLDAFVKTLAAPDTAVVDMSGNGSTYDSFGNLETSPPVTVGGVEYPFGRIYYGSKIHAAIKTFLKGQSIPAPVSFEVQEPFELDTSWLEVGHVDEVVTMLPDPAAAQGFRVLIASPSRAMEILKQADPADKLPLYGDAYKLPTVGDFLADAALIAANEDIETQYLAPMKATLMAELGVPDKDFYRVPVLFKKHMPTAALTTGMVNLLAVNSPAGGTTAVIPDPFFRADVGDRFDPYGGKQPATYDPMSTGDPSGDPFVAAMIAVLPPGVTALFVDDWMYHRLDGEVHCGTNSQRKPWEANGKPWWQALELAPLSPAPWTCGCSPQVYTTPPAFVGTPTPASGSSVDWAALDQELATYKDPQNLAFTVKVPYNPGNGCGSIPFELPVPCGPASYTDYTIWRMGGAVAVFLVPPQLPQYFNDWVHNPGYYADGMMDPFYTHPQKTVVVACQGQGVGFCAIGPYGGGTDDTALIPSDLARTDPAPGPSQPGAYNGKVRAFPVYQRAQPDLSLPEGYQLCYDHVDLHAQGGGVSGTCQNDGLDHGAIYLLFQATEKVCAAP
ncbi:MAG: protein-arginine deiminase family protein [Polyangiaceae bacterium]